MADMKRPVVKLSRKVLEEVTKKRNTAEAKNRSKITAKPTPAMTMDKKPAGKAKPKGLNDYLDKGQTPPSRNKKLPSDADVILKGYNDKKTIAKLKNKKSK